MIRIHKEAGKDPITIIKTAKYLKESLYEGAIIEKIYCVYDVDSTPEKSLKLSEDMAGKNSLITCVSNPCFEIWFLLHFKYSTSNFCSYDKVRDELLKHIPEYAKNKDVFEKLQPNQQNAIANAKRLKKYHNDLGTDSSIRRCDPSTQVYELVEYLNNMIG